MFRIDDTEDSGTDIKNMALIPAMNKFNAFMAKEIHAADQRYTDISQEPIDYSLGCKEKKRTMDKDIGNNNTIENICNAKNSLPIKKPVQSLPEKTVHTQIENSHIMKKSALDLSLEAAVPCVKSSTSINCSMQNTAKVESPDTHTIINIQQKENQNSAELLEDEKENSAVNGRMMPNKKFNHFILVCNNTKMLRVEPRILRTQKPCNTMSCVDRINHNNQPQRGLLREIVLKKDKKDSLLQGQAVNSTPNIGEENIKTNKKWTRATTYLLVDLMTEFQRKERIVSLSQLDTLWSRIAQAMKVQHYDFTDEQCRQMWNFLKNAYEYKVTKSQSPISIHAWGLFRRVHQIYNQLEIPIMTKKRAHSPGPGDHIIPKQRISAVESMKTVPSTGNYSLQKVNDKSVAAKE
ncbi:uncharacterized protein LOC105684130 isoform X1 [Athalia rosae]|uniref:uncharacterized protein LOC105684130 isoform X1 n=2 Tax=Athalia rosae TaxID=37344 RepID=UPI002033D6DB|nr:uncharacterized protein LOC105684130 isoform X1 [Athalia rosae]